MRSGRPQSLQWRLRIGQHERLLDRLLKDALRKVHGRHAIVGGSQSLPSRSLPTARRSRSKRSIIRGWYFHPRSTTSEA